MGYTSGYVWLKVLQIFIILWWPRDNLWFIASLSWICLVPFWGIGFPYETHNHGKGVRPATPGFRRYKLSWTRNGVCLEVPYFVRILHSEAKGSKIFVPRSPPVFWTQMSQGFETGCSLLRGCSIATNKNPAGKGLKSRMLTWFWEDVIYLGSTPLPRIQSW